MATFAATAAPAGFRNDRFLQGMTAWYGLFWTLTAISPIDRYDWFLENFLVFLFLGALVKTHRIFPFSRFSYALITTYLTLHAVGAHYTYAQVPLGFWLKNAFGFSRNHYDRIVHFSFGLMLAYPAREVAVRAMKMRGIWSYYFPLEFILAASALYEILEWQLAQVVTPGLGDSWLGTQGDIWDSQKDMSMAFMGALMCMGLTLALRKLHRKQSFY